MQKIIPSKLIALHPNPEEAEETRQFFSEISTQVQWYIWMKTMVSLLTGVLSYVVLKLVSVHFAA